MEDQKVTWALFFLPAWLLGLISGCSVLPLKSPATYPTAVAANRLLDQGQWENARIEYENYLMQFPQDHQARINLGRTLLALGKDTHALSQFNFIIESGSRIPTEVYFWAGRANHMLDRFSEAEMLYRTYIETGHGKLLNQVNFYMQQIGSAKKAGSADTWYLVENAGKDINSSRDEFQPVYSPNMDQRFYYSIHLPVERQGAIVEQLKPSMSSAEIRQGFWVHTGPLDADLSGNNSYHLVDFSSDGQQVLFKETKEDGSQSIYLKTFGEGINGIQLWDHPIFNANLGDRDLMVLHDSAFLFSSHRMEGFGGYDIYVTYKRLGEWVVQNLGDEINGPYDEIAPYLSKDGRELFFSSNRPESIGGFDIFQAVFDDEKEAWTKPGNMLPPLNSGRNELGFRLSSDGKEALLVSDRQGGYGGFDIYQVQFDEPRPSQAKVGNPRYFYHVRAFRSFQYDQNLDRNVAEKPVYSLPVVPFGDRPIVITPGLRVELEKVLDYCRLYPHTRLLMRIFTEKDVVDQFGLYKPVLVLKNITDFFQQEGIAPTRYEIRLYGNQYPRYSSLTSESRKHVLSNQRMEIDLINTENLPVRFGVPVMSDDQSVALSPYQQWQLRTQGLYFRIKLVESDQLIKGKEYYQFEDLMVLITHPGEQFAYFAGVFPKLNEARKARLEYLAKGYDKAEIVAFMGSSMLSDERIHPALIEEYPELKEYIIYQK